MSEHVVSDFKGKDGLLIQSIDSLLEMDAKGILVPHGIGGHARTLLRAAKAAIEQAARTVPEGYVMVPVEPTKAMIDAGRWHEYRDEGDCAVSYVEDAVVASVWSYMLSAALEVKK